MQEIANAATWYFYDYNYSRLLLALLPVETCKAKNLVS